MTRYLKGRDLCFEWVRALMHKSHECPVGMVVGCRDDGIDELVERLQVESDGDLDGRAVVCEIYESKETLTRAMSRSGGPFQLLAAPFRAGSSDAVERLCHSIMAFQCARLIVSHAELVPTVEWHKLARARRILIKQGRGLAIVAFASVSAPEAMNSKLSPLSAVAQSWVLDSLSFAEIAELALQLGYTFAEGAHAHFGKLIGAYSKKAGAIIELLRTYSLRHGVALEEENLVTLIAERNPLCLKNQNLLDAKKRSVEKPRKTRKRKAKKSTRPTKSPKNNSSSTSTQGELGLMG